MTDPSVPAPSQPRTPSLADLVMVRRPAGVPYSAGDDHDAQALLKANGYAAEPADCRALLQADVAVLQAAAARTLGALRVHAAIADLTRLVHDGDAEETARVQAAFALARLDVAGASALLVQLLNQSAEASPAPLHAANALALLGDPRGFDLVRAALDSTNPVTAMVACKQLYAFATLDGQALPSGGHVNTRQALQRALARPEPPISGEARAQLQALGALQTPAP